MFRILALALYVPIVFFGYCAVLIGMTFMSILKALRHIMISMTIVRAHHLLVLVRCPYGDQVVDTVDGSNDAFIVETAQSAVCSVLSPSRWAILTYDCCATDTIMLAFKIRSSRVRTAVLYHASLAVVASLVVLQTVGKRMVVTPALVAKHL